jgi:tetratricopeptide (TPR) repeat protein
MPALSISDFPQTERHLMPTNEAIYEEAEKLKDAGRTEEAVAKLLELVQQDDSYALAHAALAKYLTDLRRHDEAIRHGLKVCQLEPNDPFSFTALSVTYQRAGRIPEAEDAMARARMIQGGMH